ncbi:MAG: methyltransferase domain-containing protein [Ectothiorhodospiraceae bacterium]|nr:methyltransferase domain-containing protein [Chromatiales bacterium]MCP5154417.1 methyltransferase domain-containing protein [Ectothiorhodospiraceae bacterium]
MRTLDGHSIDLDDYDFLDLGASHGDSLTWARRALSVARGLGVDSSPAKVAAALAAGHDCVRADATALDAPDGSVDHVVMSHFLEHLPDATAVERALRGAVRLARRSVVVRGPWFEADTWLRTRGLKLYWSDWTGHRCHVDRTLLACVLDAVDCHDYALFARGRVDDASSPVVLPIDAPPDQHDYVASHGPKPDVRFAGNVYREIWAVVRIVPGRSPLRWSVRRRLVPIDTVPRLA